MAEQRLKILPSSGDIIFDSRFVKRGFAELTGNLTVSVIGLDNGEEITFWFTQDATGSRTVTINPLSAGANVSVGSNSFNSAANTTSRIAVVNINDRLYLEYAGAEGEASSVAFADIIGKPTTLSGYGITDAIPLSQKGAANGVAVLDGNALLPLGIMGQGTANNTNFLRGDRTWASVTFANVGSTPTSLSGYGITDAIAASQKGVANGVASLDAQIHIPVAQLGSGTANATNVLHGDGTWGAVPFADLSAKPTSLAGYGITDAIPTTQKGAANGVAALDANIHVPAVQLGSGTATNATTLHGDNTWS
jgi:hypothetical protein